MPRRKHKIEAFDDIDTRQWQSNVSTTLHNLEFYVTVIRREELIKMHKEFFNYDDSIEILYIEPEKPSTEICQTCEK